MEVRNEHFAAYIDGFTPNTYVMVVMSDASIRKSSHSHICTRICIIYIRPKYCLRSVVHGGCTLSACHTMWSFVQYGMKNLWFCNRPLRVFLSCFGVFFSLTHFFSLSRSVSVSPPPPFFFSMKHMYAFSFGIAAAATALVNIANARKHFEKLEALK